MGSSTHNSRRAFLGGSLGLITVVLAGCEKKLTPRQAKAQNIPLRTFTNAESLTLQALGEILLPGSVAAGLVEFVDYQLSRPVAESLLMLKYLGVAAPFAPFYKSALAAAELAARARYSKSCPELDTGQGADLLGAMSRGDLPEWQGPAAGLVFLVLRSDAVDVSYGTQAGFERLGLSYLPHILPPSAWGQ